MIHLFNLFTFICMYLVGALVFCSKRKHLLLMLLSMEYIILSIYMLMFVYMSMYYFSMYFLVFCICESVLGLSILVSLIRIHGNDFFLL